MSQSKSNSSAYECLNQSLNSSAYDVTLSLPHLHIRHFSFNFPPTIRTRTLDQHVTS